MADNTANRARELVESWINGNRKFVVCECANDPLLVGYVVHYLDQDQQAIFLRRLELSQ